MDHERALAALAAYEVDLALIFRPGDVADASRVIASIPQRLVAVVRADHPLAAKKVRAAVGMRRLPGGVAGPLARAAGRFSTKSPRGATCASTCWRNPIPSRCCGDWCIAATRSRSRSRSARRPAISAWAWSACPIDTRDLPTAELVLCQLRGRVLPIAAAAFSETLSKSLHEIKAS